MVRIVRLYQYIGRIPYKSKRDFSGIKRCGWSIRITKHTYAHSNKLGLLPNEKIRKPEYFEFKSFI